MIIAASFTPRVLGRSKTQPAPGHRKIPLSAAGTEPRPFFTVWRYSAQSTGFAFWKLDFDSLEGRFYGLRGIVRPRGAVQLQVIYRP